MPAPSISSETKSKILEMLKQKLGDREIARRLNLSSTTVMKYRQKAGIEAQKYNTPIPPAEPSKHQAIRKALSKGPLSVEELANTLDWSPKRVRDAVEELRLQGSMLDSTADGKFQEVHSTSLDRGKDEIEGRSGPWTHVFGVTSDNHLANRNSRLDVANAAYDHFEREGIKIVYNAGNWIDGEARFNKNELVVPPGMDNQVDYFIDKWPIRKGITTHFIAGPDHEGWYVDREGIEIGRYLQNRAETQGRHDLKYLGYGEADIELKYGSGSRIMRVVHPGGGSAYATSYTAQKLVESYTGGEKPNILLIGHYHKFEYGYPREVHCVQCGTTTDQSLFMRRNKIAAHVGFIVIKIKQGSDGSVLRFCVEWFPFYDKGYYQKFK